MLLSSDLNSLIHIPYFLDYKTHPPQIREENWGMSYSRNVACLAHWVGAEGGLAVEQGSQEAGAGAQLQEAFTVQCIL